jgi:hypothetical protein
MQACYQQLFLEQNGGPLKFSYRKAAKHFKGKVETNKYSILFKCKIYLREKKILGKKEEIWEKVGSAKLSCFSLVTDNHFNMDVIS